MLSLTLGTMSSLFWGGGGGGGGVWVIGFGDVGLFCCVCVCVFFLFFFLELYWCFSALLCSELYLVICVLFSYICFLVLGLF